MLYVRFYHQNLFINNAPISHLLMEKKQNFLCWKFVASSYIFLSLKVKKRNRIKKKDGRKCIHISVWKPQKAWIIYEHEHRFFSTLYLLMLWNCFAVREKKVPFELNYMPMEYISNASVKKAKGVVAVVRELYWSLTSNEINIKEKWEWKKYSFRYFWECNSKKRTSNCHELVPFFNTLSLSRSLLTSCEIHSLFHTWMYYIIIYLFDV